MYPYAPAPGTISGSRPTVQAPDAPLADDDRTGLRVLYPDATDTTHIGLIQGKFCRLTRFRCRRIRRA